MSELSLAAGFEIVTLVDRALNDIDRPREIIFDGVRIVFKPKQIERPVPQFLAEWVFRVDQHRVHTKDGDFVNRFAIKDAPEDLLARTGRAAADMSPIEIDTDRLEGWDTDSSPDAADRGKTRVIELKRQRADYSNDAAPAGTSFGTR